MNETIPALVKLKEAGKARFIGITGLPLGIFSYVLDRVPPGTLDVVLSYCHYCVNDTSLGDLVPYLKTKGVGIINASPLSMGLLNGILPRRNSRCVYFCTDKCVFDFQLEELKSIFTVQVISHPFFILCIGIYKIIFQLLSKHIA